LPETALLALPSSVTVPRAADLLVRPALATGAFGCAMVVKVQEWLAASALPAASFAPVVIVAV